MKVSTWLTLALLPVVLARQREHSPQTSTNNSNSDLDSTNDTQNLIAAGEYFLAQQHELSKEVVLVMGNTGAGKSTMAKFITGHDLSSYRSGTRFLIKDNSGDISFNSTMISKTFFPEKFQDNTTKTIYYDLPGFSDTRNSSMDIANAYLMKKVADRAERVKVVFIVTYSSLMAGESRTEFIKLLKHAIQIVKNPSKFSSAIALVASKVPHDLPDDEIITTIVDFLQQAKRDVGSIFTEEDDSLKSTDLINVFLTQSSNGSYNRIGFFKQPNIPGSLREMPDMQQRLLSLRTLVELNLKFVNKNADDFGISISDESANYVADNLDKLNLKFVDVLQSFLPALNSKFQPTNASLLPIPAARLHSQVERMRNIITFLKSATSRREFLQTLEDQPMLRRRNKIKSLWSLNAQLEFFELISTNEDGGRSQRKWLEPFYQHVQFLNNQISSQLQTLNSFVLDALDRFTYLWKVEWNTRLATIANQSLEEQRAKADQMSLVVLSMQNITDNLNNQTSFNGFLHAVNVSYRTEFVSFAPHEALPLNLLQDVDIPFRNAPRLRKEAWILKLQNMQQDISTEIQKFQEDLHKKEQDEIIRAKEVETAALLRKSQEAASAMELRLNQTRQAVLQLKMTKQREVPRMDKDFRRERAETSERRQGFERFRMKSEMTNLTTESEHNFTRELVDREMGNVTNELEQDLRRQMEPEMTNFTSELVLELPAGQMEPERSNSTAELSGQGFRRIPQERGVTDSMDEMVQVFPTVANEKVMTNLTEVNQTTESNGNLTRVDKLATIRSLSAVWKARISQTLQKRPQNAVDQIAGRVNKPAEASFIRRHQAEGSRSLLLEMQRRKGLNL